MNFSGRHLSLIGILLLTVFVGAAAGLYFDLAARLQRSRPAATTAQTYTCPMHADVLQNHPGDCPKCGMALVPASQSKSAHDQCAHTGQNQSGCCADKRAMPTTTDMKLPPGHPPIPGWTVETNATSDSRPASSDTPTHSH